jgi:hypothetical protein
LRSQNAARIPRVTAVLDRAVYDHWRPRSVFLVPNQGLLRRGKPIAQHLHGFIALFQVKGPLCRVLGIKRAHQYNLAAYILAWVQANISTSNLAITAKDGHTNQYGCEQPA